VAFTFDGVYVKHLCNTVKMSDWGRVYYTNLLSLVPLLVLYVVLGEYAVLRHIPWHPMQLGSLTVACILGVAMSHSGYCLRRSVTATMMALVGIICKVGGVLMAGACGLSSHHLRAALHGTSDPQPATGPPGARS
jgi:GDP-mannose transporter